MPLLGADDLLTAQPRRILVAGTSGAGKTTLATRIAAVLQVPQVEMDALYHGPGWTPRPSFVDDVRRFTAADAWVTEWQYRQVRSLLAGRTDLLVWLDMSRTRVMTRVGLRTVRRRVLRQQLWNGNIEPPLWTVLTDPQHIVRWAWSTHTATAQRVAALRQARPELAVVHLESRAAVARWVDGPLRAAACRTGPAA